MVTVPGASGEPFDFAVEDTGSDLSLHAVRAGDERRPEPRRSPLVPRMAAAHPAFGMDQLRGR
ncbi:hypothetical protein [Nonomuraea cavernae]|uniref:Uncharacterized protein n=1 Tax=Nonomuraea cavernae TaxID=2045107 RepID=A0A917ZIH9_9ACTN|nr:hypothetical protein [Nonomuraea cavernae]MCA2186654.1 hypothetical protein [Nonomuraea cavernae]GGO83281.1 hypothetical protein GCM10012289_76400 [Nonomuraea cavernae]